MAITLDTIVNKVFKVVKNGYDNNEVEAFLDEILEEMEKREAETARLKEQVASLSKELEQAKVQLAHASVVSKAPAAQSAPAANDRHAAESFELVLTKAKGAYEEIVAEADARAEAIITKANEDAAGMRAKAETQIADLNTKLAELRAKTADYCAMLKKAMDSHAATMEQINKML